MTDSDTTSGRVWITELAGPTHHGRTERRVKLSASERPERDKDQCCLSCDMVLTAEEAREIGGKLLQFAKEAEAK